MARTFLNDLRALCTAASRESLSCPVRCCRAFSTCFRAMRRIPLQNDSPGLSSNDMECVPYFPKSSHAVRRYFLGRTRSFGTLCSRLGRSSNFLEEFLSTLHSSPGKHCELSSFGLVVRHKEVDDFVQPLATHFFEGLVLGRVVLRLDNCHEAVIADRLTVFRLFSFQYANEPCWDDATRKGGLVPK